MHLISSAVSPTPIAGTYPSMPHHTLCFLPDCGTWRSPVRGIVTVATQSPPEVSLAVGADTVLTLSLRQSDGAHTPPLSDAFFLFATVGQPICRGQVIAHADLSRYRSADISPVLYLSVTGTDCTRVMREISRQWGGKTAIFPQGISLARPQAERGAKNRM